MRESRGEGDEGGKDEALGVQVSLSARINASVGASVTLTHS
jgi:hypothetical protein